MNQTELLGHVIDLVGAAIGAYAAIRVHLFYINRDIDRHDAQLKIHAEQIRQLEIGA